MLAGSMFIPGMNLLTIKPVSGDIILGHGDFKYRVNKEWGNLNPSGTPVNNCHEMVMDSKGRLIMITDEVKNNIIIYDKSGRLLDKWGDQFPGGHGLSIFTEGEEDFLFITDINRYKVFKTTVDGEIIFTIDHPAGIGIYEAEDDFRPTETAIASNGDIYVADGYGSQYIIQYNSKGEYIRHFGGAGNNDDQFSTAHGICIDDRDSNNPTLLCTSRGHNSFKRFTLDGDYLSTIFLPGAYVCRPVIDDGNIYSGVCWSRLRYLNQTPNSGFVTILDENDHVVSNPGGTEPVYRDGQLQLMVQDQPVFDHCHDVCIDEDKNLYICQWNAGKSYPIKLERV
jgi:hypothetical protein